MKELQKLIGKNLSLSITILNILLVIGVFFQKDPIGIFHKTYETSPRFIQLSPSEIVRLVYGRKENPDSTKELIRVDGGWAVKKDRGLQLSGDEERINQLLKALLESRKFTVAATGKDKFKEYGLDSEDTFLVELFHQSGSAGKFIIGTASGGSFTHVAFNDSEDIYIVEDSLKSLFGRGADDFFVNKRVPAKAVSSSEIRKVRWSPKIGKGYEISSGENGWVDADGKALEKGRVEPLLNKISSFFADSVLEESDVGKLIPTKAGILEFSVSEAGGGNPVSIEILGTDTQDFYFGKIPGKAEVYKFPSYQWNPVLDFSAAPQKN